MKQRMTTKDLALTAMLAAMAAAVHWLESMFMPLFPGLPGVKLGLANVFTLYALQTLGKGPALAISVLRCALGLFLTGAPVGTLYAFCGALMSYAVMALLHTLRFGTLAQSVPGALAHVTAQVAAAMWLTGTTGLVYYLPMVWLAAVPTGLLTGAACAGMQKALKGRTHDAG